MPLCDTLAGGMEVGNPTPYTLYPIPYTLYPIPYTLYPTPYTLHPTPYTLYPLFPRSPAPYLPVTHH